MTRDRWELHGKEIFLHKASVTHRHLKPMDFQLVVFSQSNLQERKCTFQHTEAERPLHPSLHHELSNLCFPPELCITG